MSTGMAARVAAVCVALAGLRVAHAEERRKVAVVDLSGDEKAKALRNALYIQLQSHWALRVLDAVSLDNALEGPLGLEDEDTDYLSRAKDDLARAEDFLVQFDYKHAVIEAKGAQNELVWVNPTTMIALYAEATFVLGEAYLGDANPDGAAKAFGLVHRLDPMRRLDPARYLPEIVEAYTRASPSATVHKLEVAGKGHVWIDGVERGIGPASFDVGEGAHVVQVTGPDRVTRGEVIAVDIPSVEIPDQAAPKELQVRRARIKLAHAPDPAARAGAMLELAKLLDVHDAVLIDRRDDHLDVQTWRDQAPGFSELVAYREQKPIDLLLPLAPAKDPAETIIKIPFPPPHHVDETPWYQKRWVQASAVSVVVVGVVGAILYATRDQYFNPGNGNIQVEAPGTVSR